MYSMPMLTYKNKKAYNSPIKRMLPKQVLDRPFSHLVFSKFLELVVPANLFEVILLNNIVTNCACEKVKHPAKAGLNLWQL
jgi:hypothetical protein